MYNVIRNSLRRARVWVYVCVLIYIIYISLSFTGVVNHRTTPRHATLYSNGGFFSLLLTKSHVVSVTFIHLAPPLSSPGLALDPEGGRRPPPEECRPRDLLQTREEKKARRGHVNTIWFAPSESASVFSRFSHFTAHLRKDSVRTLLTPTREYGEVSFGSSPLRSYIETRSYIDTVHILHASKIPPR